MKKLILILYIAITFISGCVGDDIPSADDTMPEVPVVIPISDGHISDESTAFPQSPDEEVLPPVGVFCGTSTNASCAIDSDCKKSGCSGQVCQGASEGSAITICDYKECYDAEKYGLACRCIGNKCRWS